MNYVDVLGYVAACFTTGSFLPQVIKVLKTRDTEALSLGMYAIFSTGVLLWLVYGLMRNDSAIILANLITFSLAAIVLTLKIVHVIKGKPISRE